jgi:GTP 3',8-cyclase
MSTFQPGWRRRKSRAFVLEDNSSARRTVELDLWGQRLRIYANANLSVYSGQRCNGACPFCVEELRPAARGRTLADERRVEPDDRRYFSALEAVLRALRPLDPSVSITGGEPSLDPRLPRLLRTLHAHGARKRTITTNGSGLLQVRDGRAIVDWLAATSVRHLNLSRAHPDGARNALLMRLGDGLDEDGLRAAVLHARQGGMRVRLSCVLLDEGVHDLDGIRAYLAFAQGLGVDNVVFRQLMGFDPRKVRAAPQASYARQHHVALEPLLDEVSADPRFTFVRQVLGYYYYVEVWQHLGIDVVFEEADLAQIEAARQPGLVHELVFHPDGTLATTWQPWDGGLGPRREWAGASRTEVAGIAGISA